MRSFSLLTLWGVPQAFASENFLSNPSTMKMTNTPVIDEKLEPEGEISVDKATVQDMKKTEVNVELIEHWNSTRQVTSFDLRVSLAESTHEDPQYFICSYLVLKKLPPTKMYEEDTETGEWVLAKKGIAYDQRNFVESEVSGHDDEVHAGTRMSCTGMLEIRNPEAPGSFMSLFDANGTKTIDAPTAADITVLELMIINEDETKSAQLYYAQPTPKSTPSNEKGRFFLTGDHVFNDPLFIEQGRRNEDRETQLTARRRQLNYYKFRCRFLPNEKTLIIKMTIVADEFFCNDYAGGKSANCKDNAMSIVLLASEIMRRQLNVRLSMESFVRVSWNCDYSLDFKPTLQRLENHVLRLPSDQRTALVHFFTSCMPKCWYATQRCSLTLGLAYIGGMSDQNSARGRNIGINRVPDSNTFTFVHEVGHSLGFNHYFGIANRNVHDREWVRDGYGKHHETSFGVMDYVADQQLMDPDIPNLGIYNGLQQLTPRHDDTLKYNYNKSDDIVCALLKRAESDLDRYNYKYKSKFALEDTTTTPTTPTIPRPTPTPRPTPITTPRPRPTPRPTTTTPNRATKRKWTREQMHQYWLKRREQLMRNYFLRRNPLYQNSR